MSPTSDVYSKVSVKEVRSFYPRKTKRVKPPTTLSEKNLRLSTVTPLSRHGSRPPLMGVLTSYLGRWSRGSSKWGSRGRNGLGCVVVGDARQGGPVRRDQGPGGTGAHKVQEDIRSSRKTLCRVSSAPFPFRPLLSSSPDVQVPFGVLPFGGLCVGATRVWEPHRRFLDHILKFGCCYSRALYLLVDTYGSPILCSPKSPRLSRFRRVPVTRHRWVPPTPTTVPRRWVPFTSPMFGVLGARRKTLVPGGNSWWTLTPVT